MDCIGRVRRGHAAAIAFPQPDRPGGFPRDSVPAADPGGWRATVLVRPERLRGADREPGRPGARDFLRRARHDALAGGRRRDALHEMPLPRLAPLPGLGGRGRHALRCADVRPAGLPGILLVNLPVRGVSGTIAPRGPRSCLGSSPCPTARKPLRRLNIVSSDAGAVQNSL